MVTVEKTGWRFWKKNPDKAALAGQLLLITVMAGSCFINVVTGMTVASDSGDAPERITAAGIVSALPPVVFFALTEVVLLSWSRELPHLGRWCLGGLILLVGGAAGWWSFMEQVAFARTFLHLGDDDLRAFALPFITDAAALAMTILLFQLKDAPARKRKPKPQREEADIATIGFFPRWRIRLFGGAAKVPELPETTQVEAVRDGFTNAVDEVHEPLPEASANDLREVHEPVVKPAAKPNVKPSSKVREPAIDPELELFIPAAKWMLDRREVTRKSEVEVAAIIKLIDAGLNSYEVRKELGGSTDTADKVSRAWQRWQAEQVAQDQYQLTAVG